MNRTLTLRLSGVALFAAAAAWAIHQQAAYIAASWSCTHAPEYVWLSGAAAFVLLIVGSLISWRALGRARSDQTSLRARHFLAQVALMASLIFAFALALQVAAAFFLPGCSG